MNTRTNQPPQPNGAHPVAYDTASTHTGIAGRSLLCSRTAMVVVAVFVMIELAARLLGGGLPNPDWNFAQTDRKVAEIEALAAAGETVDLVLLGNSSVNSAFLDREIERQGGFGRVYNAGLDGSSVRQMEDWAMNVVVPQLQPETVVIGLTSRDLNDASVSNAEVFGNYLNSRGRARFLGEETTGQRVQQTLGGVSALVQISPFLRDPASLVTQYDPTGPPTGEFVLPGEDYSPRPFDITRTRERALNDYAVGGIELESLDRLVTELEEAGIEVIMMEMPFIAEDWLPLHPNGSSDYQAFRVALLDFAATRDLPLIDLTTYPWTTSEFYDFLHVNSAGIARINTMLAEELIKLDTQA